MLNNLQLCCMIIIMGVIDHLGVIEKSQHDQCLCLYDQNVSFQKDVGGPGFLLNQSRHEDPKARF